MINLEDIIWPRSLNILIVKLWLDTYQKYLNGEIDRFQIEKELKPNLIGTRNVWILVQSEPLFGSPIIVCCTIVVNICLLCFFTNAINQLISGLSIKLNQSADLILQTFKVFNFRTLSDEARSLFDRWRSFRWRFHNQEFISRIDRTCGQLRNIYNTIRWGF